MFTRIGIKGLIFNLGGVLKPTITFQFASVLTCKTFRVRFKQWPSSLRFKVEKSTYYHIIITRTFSWRYIALHTVCLTRHDGMQTLKFRLSYAVVVCISKAMFFPHWTCSLCTRRRQNYSIWILKPYIFVSDSHRYFPNTIRRICLSNEIQINLALKK